MSLVDQIVDIIHQGLKVLNRDSHGAYGIPDKMLLERARNIAQGLQSIPYIGDAMEGTDSYSDLFFKLCRCGHGYHKHTADGIFRCEECPCRNYGTS